MMQMRGSCKRLRSFTDNRRNVSADPTLRRATRAQPSFLDEGSWQRLFAEMVVPRLAALHPAPRAVESYLPGSRPPGSPLLGLSHLVWHAALGAPTEFAEILLQDDAGGIAQYVDGLLDQGAGFEPLCCEVFEPAARHIGNLWTDDRCDDLGIVHALGQLQIEVRRSSMMLPSGRSTARPGHAVLIAAQPGETHAVNVVMCSELFWRDGWQAHCEFASSIDTLSGLLKRQWFDVLDLSLSGAVQRDGELHAMRRTIRAAQTASLNPALAVIVDGRTFTDHPAAYLDVGADCGCASATNAVAVAEKLLGRIPQRVLERAAVE